MLPKELFGGAAVSSARLVIENYTWHHATLLLDFARGLRGSGVGSDTVSQVSRLSAVDIIATDDIRHRDDAPDPLVVVHRRSPRHRVVLPSFHTRRHIRQEAAEPLRHRGVRENSIAQHRIRQPGQHHRLHRGHDLAGFGADHREAENAIVTSTD